MNNKDWLTARSQATPNRIALLFEGQVYTYAELDQKVIELSGRLAAVGVGAGVHVAALMPNSDKLVILIHALSRLGAVLVPLNLRLTTKELRWQLGHVDCQYLISDREQPELNGGWMNHTFDNLPEPIHHKNPSFDIDRTQAIIFTSGTTGNPKGAQLSYANHFWSATTSAYRLGVLPNDRWLAAMPLYHVGGMAIILRSCLYGIGVVLQDGFDEDAVLNAIDQDSVSVVSLVPTMLHRLMKNEMNIKTLKKLRLILLGGAAADHNLIEICLEADLPISLTYGLTEAASQVATASPDQVRAKLGMLGKPLMFSSLRIANENGNDLSPNEIGEIVVGGRTVMQGYYPNTLKDTELFTGDLGYLDDDGDLFVVQRRVDLIVSGGENIYPSEVERVLLDYPGIEMACVTGIDDPEWGQIVVAVLVASPGQSLNKDEVIDHCRLHLAGYKAPKQIFYFDVLPQTASGKIKRKEVRELVSQKILEEPVRA